MARLPDPLDTLSPDAKRVYDKISAKRGAIRGPSLPSHAPPGPGRARGDLGEPSRFDSSLPGDIRELAVLITRPRGQPDLIEWYAHAKIARRRSCPTT